MPDHVSVRDLPAPDGMPGLIGGMRMIDRAAATSDPLADAMRSLESCLAFAANDWGADRRAAWLYGIVVGWCEPSSLCANCNPAETEGSGVCILNGLAASHGWTADDLAALRRFRAAFAERVAQGPSAMGGFA